MTSMTVGSRGRGSSQLLPGPRVGSLLSLLSMRRLRLGCQLRGGRGRQPPLPLLLMPSQQQRQGVQRLWRARRVPRCSLR